MQFLRRAEALLDSIGPHLFSTCQPTRCFILLGASTTRPREAYEVVLPVALPSGELGGAWASRPKFSSLLRQPAHRCLSKCCMCCGLQMTSLVLQRWGVTTTPAACCCASSSLRRPTCRRAPQRSVSYSVSLCNAGSHSAVFSL